ncbi:MAG: phage virion morphogenesis protein [Bacteroidota bacterium]
MPPFQNTLSSFWKAISIATRLVGNDMVNDAKENFIKQGFDGIPWKEVQRRIAGTKAYKYPKRKGTNRRTRAILIGAGSGRLKKSIRVTQITNTEVAIGSDVPYAEVHNEGKKAGRGAGFMMPQRKYMGLTKTLDAQIEKRINQAMDDVFNA